jgi:RNA polymerase primary sigma factor/RNA polymerase sigma factor
LAVGERVLTVDELARQFHVSTKTVSRWRQRGLVARRFLFDGRRRLGFLQSSVDRFAALNEERIRRGAQFRQLTDGSQTDYRHACLAREAAAPRSSPRFPKRRAEAWRRSGTR